MRLDKQIEEELGAYATVRNVSEFEKARHQSLTAPAS